MVEWMKVNTLEHEIFNWWIQPRLTDSWLADNLAFCSFLQESKWEREGKKKINEIIKKFLQVFFISSMHTLFPDPPKTQVIFSRRNKVESEHKSYGTIGLSWFWEWRCERTERVRSWVDHILFSSYVWVSECILGVLYNDTVGKQTEIILGTPSLVMRRQVSRSCR